MEDGPIQIRPNKRWLAKRRRELSAGQASPRQMAEIGAIDTALKALNSPEGAIRFRQQLKEGCIKIIGGLSGGAGGGDSTAYAVAAIPRKGRDATILDYPPVLPSGTQAIKERDVVEDGNPDYGAECGDLGGVEI
jgi:hypothetical protein